MIWTQPMNINEGEGGGAGAGAAGAGAGAVGAGEGGETAVPMQDCPSMNKVAIDTTKVLGKCDHEHDGYMGKNCFHIPKKIMPTLHRWELCNGGSKRKKDKNGKDKKYAYEKGMKVITSYQDLVEALGDASKTSFIFNIPHDKISEICDQDLNDNARFQKNQFMKLVGDNDVEFVGLFTRDDKKCLSLAALRYGLASAGQMPDDCYINEIQSFKKGYGKALLKRILETQEKVWLCANPEQPKTLVDFYKQPDLGLNEYVVEKSCWNDGAPAHFFYTDDCNEVALTEFIDANYSQENVQEANENDPFGSMMNAMNSNKADRQENNTTSDASNDERNKADDQFDVVPDALGFEEVGPNDIIDADTTFFCHDFEPKKVKHIYTLKVTSMNNDDTLEYDDQLLSDKPMSFNELVSWFWPKIPKGYGVENMSFIEAGKKYAKSLADAKDEFTRTGNTEALEKVMEIPFPVIHLSYGNSKSDMIQMTPIEHEFDELTKKGIPAALVTSDNDSQLKFNKFATDKIYVTQIIGESKNKVTNNAKVIIQKKQSLKSTTTSKPKAINKVALKKDATEAKQVKQQFKHVKKVSRTLQDKLMSRQSKQQKKHSRKVSLPREFQKPVFKAKSITFPREEISSLKDKDVIVTTRVSDDYDKFQLGDVVKASQLGNREFRVIARCNISDVTEHPLFKELTYDQVDYLGEFDKIAVLTLA